MTESRAIYVPTSQANSYFTSPCIKVHVGKDDAKKEYNVHKALLTSRSEFFARALNGKWKESDDGTVTLPKDEPEIFRLYLEMIYTNALPVGEEVSIYIDTEKKIKKTTEALEKDVNAATRQELTTLCKLYVLSEKLQDPVSKDSVVVALVKACDVTRPDTSKYLPGAVNITQIYKGTVAGNRLRRLLVDQHVWHAQANWFSKHKLEDFCAEFLYDFSIRTLQVNKKDDPDLSKDAANYLEGKATKANVTTE